MGQLKRQQRWWRGTSAGLAILIAMFLGVPLAGAGTADSEPVQLQLDVRVNGYPLNLIAAFMAMRAFGVNTEPWIFVIDAKGMIVYRVEGIVTPDEIEKRLKPLTVP